MGKLTKYITKTSITKTIRFNLRYFGLKRLLKPYALIAHGVQFKCLKGSIDLQAPKVGAIKIGYPSLGTQNDSVTKGTINLSGKVIVGECLSLARGASLDCGPNGVLEIGSLSVTGDTKIICKKNIRIGKGCMISWGGGPSWTPISTISIKMARSSIQISQ